MSIDAATVAGLAAELEAAERSHIQIGHLSSRFPDMTIADGYAIQRAWMKIKADQGRVPIGRKIGLTSRAMQRAVNITEPDYGLLLDDMLFATGGDVPFDRFIEPRVEVELAFVLKRRLEGRGHHLRCAERDRLCRPGDRDHRRADRADRSDDRGHAQGVRHDLRQCRRCRDRDGREPGEARCDRPALGLRIAAPQRRDRGNGRRRRRAQPPRQWRRLARQQAGSLWRGAGAGTDHPRGSFTAPSFAGRGDSFHADYGRWAASRCASHDRFQQAIAQGRAQIGLWQALASAYTAEICAGAGFDWLLIDGEHAPNDLRTVLAQLQAVAAYPAVEPVVRLPVGDPVLVKQYLDIGARALLIPMVESADQAARLVQATRYPPHGVRGVGSAIGRASRWNRTADYLTTAQDDICLLLQVESVPGLAHLDAVAATDGVDGVFIGPSDLAAALGHIGNPAHPAVQAAIEDAIARILKAGKAAGILIADQALARRYLALGASFVAVGTDVTILARGAEALASAFGAVVQADRGGVY